ncbi:DUF2155 domain-containing protein [Niveispirillum fermenti]|uniref:DUF2155 domain-containing protein n=1 Tax=Niveispirillum fermenti TaxID=1233113 RepID=UPI003A8BA75D
MKPIQTRFRLSSLCLMLLAIVPAVRAQEQVPAGEPALDEGQASSLPGAVQRPAPPPPPERSFDPMPVALLQGLDKVTARTSTFEAKVGEVVRFGQLSIRVEACRKAPPIDPPESAAFLNVQEQRPDGGEVAVFNGWMFASSPALSAMEHPVYDVWVKDCKKVPTSARSSSRQ